MRGTTAAMNKELGGFKTAGVSAGKSLAAGVTDGVKEAEAGLAKATRAHRKFAETARSATARRAVEVEKLTELESKGITTGSRWLAQQERVTAARNRERDAVLNARTALDNMTSAQKRASDTAKVAESNSRKLGLGLRSVGTEAQAASKAATTSLQQISTTAEVQGSAAGARFTAGLGVLKTGAAAVGVAGGGALGLAFSKGLSRLTAIDDAKGKLSALGHDTQSTAKIMDSALASVKGTAYGLGDAANIAASAVAAGIKPGEQLTNYLTMTADAAAIAGVGLSEMGSILNKVQTGTIAYTGDLNQLADRGIPIYQWLQDELKVSARELKEMVSSGEVDSATYFRAIEKNIGGAAKTIGSTTVRGAYENLGAALGRLGAEALGEGFQRLPGFLTMLTNGLDAATPKVTLLAQKLDEKVFGEWGPKLVEGFESGQFDSTLDTFGMLAELAKDAAPAVLDVASSLGQASATLGVSGWQLFVTALQLGVTTLEIINPLLSTTADFMRENQGLVTALVAGWLAFKTIPNLVGNVTNTLGPMAAGLRNAGGNISAFGSAYRTSLDYVRQANPTISTAGAHLQVLRANASNAGGALSMMRGGAAGLLGALGGPVGLGLTATVAAGGWALQQYAQHQQEAAQRAAEHKRQVDALSESINFNTGALDENGKKQVYQSLAENDVFKDARAAGAGVSSAQIQSAAEGQAAALDEVNAALDRVVMKHLESGGVTDRFAQKLRDAGFSMEDYTAALRGNEDVQRRINEGLGTNMDFDVLAKDMDEASQAAIRVGQNIGTSTDTIKEAQDAARQQAEALGLVQQRIESISSQFAGQGKGFSINVDTTQIAGTETILQRLGFTLESLPNGQVKVTANTDEATASLQTVVSNVELLNALKANPQIDLNKAQFDAKAGAAHAALMEIDRTAVDGEAGLVIDKLIEGKDVSMNELIKLDQTTANPKVDMLIDKIMEKVGIVNTGLDDAARPRTAMINVRYQGYDIPAGIVRPDLLPQNANGSITIPAFATGGMRNLTQATTLTGSGAGRLYQTPAGPARAAEGETVVESWIPWAASKRSRATDILATTAQAFGYALVPTENLPSGAAALLGALTGGAAERLLSLTGVDQLATFAEGGVRADDFRRLAQGVGASRPLTGAPYDWGGVNWGDCSATGSAFARQWAGLDPFGGRTATGGAAAYFAQLGLQQGRGQPGDLRIAFYNGGPGGGHMTTQLPTGENAEMGGNNGGGMLGGSAASPDEPQFTDHWFGRVGPSWTDPGSDAGGWVQRPDGTWVPTTVGPGYGATGGTSGVGAGSTIGTGNSISGRFGSAIGAFFEGQLADAFSTVNVNDQPGWLQAIVEYENMQRSQQESASTAGPSASGASSEELARMKREFEDDKEAARQAFEDDKLARRQERDAELDRLRAERDAKRISKAEYERRADELKRKFDETELQKRQEYDSATLDSKQKYDDLVRTTREQQSTNPGASAMPPVVTDPGTMKPQPGEDLGGAAPTTGNGIKDAFRSGLRQAWQSGEPWSATDWIVGKESTWNPNARNGKYFGLGQLGPEAWAASGIAPTADPRMQAKAYDHYVGDRYQDPMRAKAHHLQAGWYDVGGRIKEGPSLLLNGLGHEETALPFDPDDLMSALTGWDGAEDVLSSIHRAIDGDGGGGRSARGGVTFVSHVTLKDDDEYYRRRRQEHHLAIRRRSGGRALNG